MPFRLDSMTLTSEKIKTMFGGIQGAILLAGINSQISSRQVDEVFSMLQDFNQNQAEWTQEIWTKKWDESHSTTTDMAVFGNFATLAFALSALFSMHETKPLSGNRPCPELEEVWAPIQRVLLSDIQQWFFVKTGVPGMEAVTLFHQREPVGKLVRLHIWLPNGNRGPQNFQTHVHQMFGQSWVLTGEGHDTQYAYHSTDNPPPGIDTSSMPQMAQYELLWPDDNDPSGYVNHYNGQVAKRVRTNEVYYLQRKAKIINKIDTTYTIPNNVAHTADIPDHQIHATLFIFNGEQQGFIDNAPIFGPLEPHQTNNANAKLDEQSRLWDRPGIGQLIDMVDAQRRLELYLNPISSTGGADVDMKVVGALVKQLVHALEKAGFEKDVSRFEIQMLTDRKLEIALFQKGHEVVEGFQDLIDS